MADYDLTRIYAPRVIVEKQDVVRIFGIVLDRYNNAKAEASHDEGLRYYGDHPPSLSAKYSDGTTYKFADINKFFEVRTSHKKNLKEFSIKCQHKDLRINIELGDSYYGSARIELEGKEVEVVHTLDQMNQILVPTSDISSRVRTIPVESLYVILVLCILSLLYGIRAFHWPIDSYDIFLLLIVGVGCLLPLSLLERLRDGWSPKTVFNWGDGKILYERGLNRTRLILVAFPLWIISTILIPLLMK